MPFATYRDHAGHSDGKADGKSFFSPLERRFFTVQPRAPSFIEPSDYARHREHCHAEKRLAFNGVYLPAGDQPVFRHVPAPTSAQLQALVQQIVERIGRLLERRGLIERDIENAWLTTDGPGGAQDDLTGHSITYRNAVGSRAGQRLFTLQTSPASVRSSNDCAATSAARQSPWIAWRSHRQGRCATP